MLRLLREKVNGWPDPADTPAPLRIKLENEHFPTFYEIIKNDLRF